MPHDVQSWLNATIDSVSSCVIQLYAVDDRRRSVSIGSAVALRLSNGVPLVVTAGHVADDTLARPVFTIGSSKTSNVVMLTGEGYRSDRQPDDRIDLAAFRVSDASAADLAAGGVQFLSQASVSSEAPHDGIYAFTGYPFSKNRFRPDHSNRGRVNIIPDVLSVIYVPLASDESYRRLGYDSHTHVLARLERKKVSRSGRQPPHPKGMSGGAVFCVAPPLPATGFARLSLVGIGIEYRERDRILVAANGRCVTELMRMFQS